MPPKKPAERESKLKPTVVVGIGASAGSVRIIRSVLEKLKKSSRKVAYVLVQHLDESGKKLTIDSLLKFSPLPVHVITEGLRVEAGAVFWVPPHSTVSIKKGRFSLKPAKTTEQKLAVIDSLFISLAEEFANSTVGVVLSGEGSDGAMGIHAINNAGGLTIVQNPKTAEYPSMPQSAIALGGVDHIVDQSEISTVIERNAKSIAHHSEAESGPKIQNQITSLIVPICEVLFNVTKQDFKHYKTSTLVRRIQRRMQVLQLDSADQYLERLTNSEEETSALFRELLINVTSFFRDTTAFDALKTEVLPKLVESTKPNEKLRIWIAGCATGEEAYTIAILMFELVAGLENRPEIQIIATDIDPHALNVARKGSYPLSIANYVPAEFLTKYFTKRGGRLHVAKQIRELCLFSIHNLISDPPFSQIDLVCCRNVLIYLGSHLQKKLFPVFHYALKKNGYLFLGASESLTGHKELFRAINPKARIAQKKATAIRMPSAIPSSVNNYLSHFHEIPKEAQPDLSMIGQRIALDEIPLRYAVVNDEGHILSGSSGLGKYVEIGEGPFQNSIVKLSKPSLRPALRRAFALAKEEKRKVVDETLSIKTETGTERVGIIVQPMPQLGEESSLYWIAFQYLGVSLKTAENDAGPVATAADLEIVDRLEREVFVLREELDRTVQDLEASNEELKSSNEELLSMNEELQSTNEEMETSKEEIQLVNDTLQRVNADLENLLAGTQIATLFLDEKLRIRSFTPAITEIYRIKESDIGRDIRDFNSAAVQMPKYPESIAEETIENEMRLPDGRIFHRRVMPYKNHENIRDGFVVTFIDVTNLRALELQYRELANSMPNIVWTTNEKGETDYLNDHWYEFSGYDRSVSGEKSWLPILHPEDANECVARFEDAFKNGTVFEMEYRFWDRKHSRYRWFLGRAIPVRDDLGHIRKWIGSAVDIDERVLSEEARRESEKLFQIISDNAPALIWLSGRGRKRKYFNKGWRDFTGQSLDEALDDGWQRAVHPEDLQDYLDVYDLNFGKQTEFGFEYRLRHHSGEYRWIGAKVVPRTNSDGEFDGFIGACLDIHEQHVAREIMAESERRLETMIETSPSFMCVLRGKDHRFQTMNDQYRILIGHRDVLGKTVLEAIPEMKGQGFIELLDEVLQSGKPHIGREQVVYLERTPGAPQEKRYLDFVYQPYQQFDGKVDGILVHGVDVTEKVISRSQIENERSNFRNLFKETPEMVCILKGPDHVFEFVNEAHVRVLGFDATGKTVRQAQPESTEVHGILDSVYQTGKTAELHEIAVTLGKRLRYFNLTYSARRDDDGAIDGVMILGLEVTEQVMTRESYKLQRDALQLALNQAPMENVLEVLARMVELQTGGELIASILLADKDGKHLLHGAAPNLPKEYNEVIHGIRIGPEVGSCGTAAFTKQQVIVEDIERSYLWKDFLALTRLHGLRSCWSTPILTAKGKLLGTFAIYSRNPRAPTENELQYIGVASQITALIIERQFEITERLDREEQLAFATGSARMGMWNVQLPQGKVSLSKEAALLFGFSNDYATTDLAIDEFIHPDYRDHARKTLTDAIQNKVLYSDEYQIVRPNGEMRWISARGHTRYDKSGMPTLLTGLIMDITEQKRADLEVKRAKLDAENASAAKTRFLANMSHEIRTPLSAIIGFSDLLQAQLKEDRATNGIVERISRNAVQLGRLVDELLDLSKIEAEKLEIEMRSIDIDEIIEDAHSSMVLRAESKGIRLNFRWTSEKPKEIVTDPTRLSQMLVNIVGNAVKFTEQGFVDVEFSTNGKKLVVLVKDSGIGLSDEQRLRIFDPFMQADSSVTRKYGGTGLGLALSRRIANLLGGDITLDRSEVGHGSTFKIEIPIDSTAPATAPSKKRDLIDPSLTLKGKRILLVDDSPDNRLLVSSYLKSTEAEIIEATNGKEAVEAAEKVAPDIILLDIQMPVMDGYQAIQQLRAQGFEKPIVALTAHAFKEERDRCMAMGFSGYVTKPVNRQLLKSTIFGLLTT